MEEFSKAVKVNVLSFCKNKVLIIWNWIWQEENQQSMTSSSEFEANVQEVSDENSDLNTVAVSGDIKHSVVFKCIGATKETRMQLQKIEAGEVVPVHIQPEPDDPVDARAIAFECVLNNKWERIGYVVREDLEPVHDALHHDLVLEVKFSWIKYVVHWSRSGPGWYAGITITKQGYCPPEVVRCASNIVG